MDNLQRFSEDKLPDKECIYGSLKDVTTGDNGKPLNGHVGDALTCTKIWI